MGLAGTVHGVHWLVTVPAAWKLGRWPTKVAVRARVYQARQVVLIRERCWSCSQNGGRSECRCQLPNPGVARRPKTARVCEAWRTL